MAPVQAELDLFSIGAVASQASRSVRTIEQAAAALELSPVLRINSIAHFDSRQVELILARLNEGRD